MSLRTNSVKQLYFDLTMRMFVKQMILLLRISEKRLKMRWKFSKIMLRMNEDTDNVEELLDNKMKEADYGDKVGGGILLG